MNINDFNKLIHFDLLCKNVFVNCPKLANGHNLLMAYNSTKTHLNL